MNREFKKIGKNGGLSIPVKLRRELGFYPGDAVAVERTENGGLLIKAYNRRCSLCGSIDTEEEKMLEIDENVVCGRCAQKIMKAEANKR